MQKRTKLRFYNGLKNIGGTVVSVEYGDYRIIFDFGLNYSPESNVDPQVKIRESSRLKDMLKLKMIPVVDGIYAEEELDGMDNIVSFEDCKINTSIIISHLHLDHMGAIGMLSDKIDVYMNKESYELYEKLNTSGERVIKNWEKGIEICEFNKIFSVGSIKITPIEIDHDVYGAGGFHIETPDRKIAYTGDYRFHGNNPELTHEYIEKTRAFKPDVLVTETTMVFKDRIDEEGQPEPSKSIEGINSEKGLLELIKEKLLETKGIGIFNVYNRNINRLTNFIHLAKAVNRTAVFELNTAYLIKKLTNEKDFRVTITKDAEARRNNNKLETWEKKIIEEFEVVSIETINDSPKGYFVQNSFENNLELLDYNVEEGVYIHSNGVPLGAFDPAYEKLTKFIEFIGFKYEYCASPGHALHQNIKYFVDEINPAVFVPLHGFAPSLTYPSNSKQFLPEYDEIYVFEEGTLKNIEN
ncbi:MAG: MBL fold metallo-hydrolase [Alkaliphilus sp.]